MKNTVIATALSVVFIMLGLQYGILDAPAAPEPISVKLPTEASIKEAVKREQNEKVFKKAIASVRLVYRRNHVRDTYSELTARAALDLGISPRLLAGLVVVESHGNPNAKDGLGSIGLTQVNSKVWGRKNLRDPETNLRVGSRILANYIHRFGLVEGLHHYNGYSDVHEHVYVNKVLTAAGIAASIPKG